MRGLNQKIAAVDPTRVHIETFRVCRYKFRMLSDDLREATLSALVTVTHVRSGKSLTTATGEEASYLKMAEFVMCFM